jgi:hypothetical protein
LFIHFMELIPAYTGCCCSCELKTSWRYMG